MSPASAQLPRAGNRPAKARDPWRGSRNEEPMHRHTVSMPTRSKSSRDQPLFLKPAEMPLIDMCRPLRVASSSVPAR